MSQSPFSGPALVVPQVALPSTWKFKTLKEILENPPPLDPPWRIRGMMADGCGTQISSHPHGMKSYTWLQAMIEASLGLPIWGHFESIAIKKTLFLETEDPELMVAQRVHRLAMGMNIKASDCENCSFVMGNLGPFDLVACRDYIKRLFDHYKPDVAVLSTLQGLLGGRDWKEQSQMQDVNALLVQIAHEYCPLTVITHSPWDPKLKRSAGSVTQAANYQTLMHYEKFSSYIKVRLDSKLDESSQFRIKIVNMEGDGLKFHWAIMDGQEAINQYLLDHPNETSQQIAEHFGCSDRYIRKLRNNSKAIVQSNSTELSQNKFDKFRIDHFSVENK